MFAPCVWPAVLIGASSRLWRTLCVFCGRVLVWTGSTPLKIAVDDAARLEYGGLALRAVFIAGSVADGAPLYDRYTTLLGALLL